MPDATLTDREASPPVRDATALAARDWLLLLGLALLVRLPFLLWPAFHGDVLIYVDWARLLVDRGVPYVYVPGATTVQESADYPPLFLYVLWVIGLVYAHVEPDFSRASAALVPWIKLPAVLGDLALAALLAWELARRRGGRAGLLAGALYAFNPATIYTSAFWGQVDCLPSLWMLVAVFALERGWPARGAVAYALALGFKPLALSIAPVLLVGSLWRGGLASLARSLLAGLAALLVVASPFLVAGTLGELLGAHVAFVGEYPWLTAGALNLHYLLTGAPTLWSWVRDLDPLVFGLSFRAVGILLLAGWLLLVGLLLARSPSPLALHLAAALCAIGWFYLLTAVHERHLLPALPFLVVLAVSERRYLLPFLALSAALSLNLFVAIQWYEQAGPLLQKARLFFSEDFDREWPLGVLVALTYAAVAGYLLWRLAQDRPTVLAANAER